MKESIILSKYISIFFETPSVEVSEWFGYYNYDPLNGNQDKMLCNRATFDGIAPEKGLKIELGYYDIPDGKWHHIGDSDSWNWQQGAMLQWLPGKDNEDRVIYNCSDDNHLISRIYNISTKEIIVINWPIYGITPDWKKSISLDLERSRWCRAYHYKSIDNFEKEGRVIEDDGIFEINLENNTCRRIISINEIIGIDYQPSFDKCKHWVEHIMISPQGTRFCFLHRFSPVDNVFRYTTRLMIADIDGSNLELVKGWEDVQHSHFGWQGEDKFVAYAYKKPFFQSSGSFKNLLRRFPFSLIGLVKKTYMASTVRMPFPLNSYLSGLHKYYQFYKFSNGEVFPLEKREIRDFYIDGHPSFTSDGRYMITDTYPDKSQYQSLMVYDTITKKNLVLGRFFAYYHGNPASCDLHPKLSRNNKFVVVDTAYNERHHMIVFQLNWELIKKVIS